MFKVNVEGLKELQQTLKNLGEDITDMMEEATVAGATVVVRAAQENSRKGHPKHTRRITGDLFNSIRIQDKRKYLNRIEIDVGSSQVHARMNEFGGTIRPKKGRFLKFKGKDGEWVFAKSVQIPPRPFLRPALDENVSEIEAAVEKKIKEIVERYT